MTIGFPERRNSSAIIPAMTFRELLREVETLAQSGDAIISGVQYDSRQVRPGDAFIAIKGETADGNLYIDAALKVGAAAIISDSREQTPRAKVPWAVVEHGRRALAAVSANFYGHPAAQLKLIGITGTNGKTTTGFLLAQMLERLTGADVVLIGTVEYHYAGQVLPAPHTTPEALELNRIFARAVDPKLGRQRSADAVMEVSSHALEQERVFGLAYDAAIFTNLTRDHLDYHHTMEKYFAAKQKLFAGCGAPSPRLAVINNDDEYGAKLADFSRSLGSKVLTYGIKTGEFRAPERDLRFDGQGTRLVMYSPAGKIALHSKLVGRMNVYNLLASVAVAQERGASLGSIAEAVAAGQSAPGRFQRVDCGQPFAVVVDYAHTDDALRNLTAVARDFISTQKIPGRVITLFGCGGDRDKSKRPLMGEAAGQGSNFVVLTSDNPRSEAPLAIIEDALPGLKRTGTPFSVEPDRRQAIALAIAEARAGDIVLLAGKGHEKVQITRRGSAPFDDAQVAREMLEKLMASPANRASRTRSGQ
jgi:UDP-N-acetylmuramoyl-L-alanyl-D-glutamate--2,6-diaminopimelate ligase